MNETITYEDCLELYSYFYSKVSGSPGFVFRPRSQERVCIETFLKKTKDLFGPVSLFNYLIFGFCKYEGLDTTQGRNNVKAMWIFGQKTFQDYVNRDHEKSAYWSEKMRKTYRIKRSDLIEEIEDRVDMSDLNSRERKRFTDSNRQLVHCTELGLYREKSAICIVCINKPTCSRVN